MLGKDGGVGKDASAKIADVIAELLHPGAKEGEEESGDDDDDEEEELAGDTQTNHPTAENTQTSQAPEAAPTHPEQAKMQED